MSKRQAIAIALAIPFGPLCIVFAFCLTLVKGIGFAFWSAWNSACLEVSSIRREVTGRTIKDFDE